MLSEAEYVNAAKIVGCDVPTIKAVTSVESGGSGFNPDNSPKLLFEGHWFHRLTKGRFAVSYPTISYPKWTKQYYGKTWQEENKRFATALMLDPQAAELSTSWGLFQILGVNFARAGFRNVNAFVDAMKLSEGAHLEAFCNFVLHSGLDDELREHRWADFAKAYNGPLYAQNHYAEKLAAAWIRHGGTV